jgi:hypothetical protein
MLIFRRLNIYVICMEVITIVLLLPSIIWESIQPIPASVYFLEFSLVFILISCITLSIYAGLLNIFTLITSKHRLETIFNFTRHDSTFETLQSVIMGNITFKTIYGNSLQKTKWVLILSIPMFLFMVTVIAFSLADAISHPWIYIILHFLLRNEEFGFVFCAVQIVSRKPLLLGISVGPSMDSILGDSDSVKLDTINASATT